MDWAFFSEPITQLIIATAVLLILVVIGLFILGKIRGEVREKRDPSVDWLSEFRELREKGVISDSEYESIRANLSAKLQSGSGNADKAGSTAPSDSTGRVGRRN